MRFLCLGYYDPEVWDGLSDEERRALGERCRPHDEAFTEDLERAVEIASLHPAARIGREVGFSMGVRAIERVWVEDGEFVEDHGAT